MVCRSENNFAVLYEFSKCAPLDCKVKPYSSLFLRPCQPSSKIFNLCGKLEAKAKERYREKLSCVGLSIQDNPYLPKNDEDSSMISHLATERVQPSTGDPLTCLL